MYLSTHDVFKSHAVFLFYILKGEFEFDMVQHIYNITITKKNRWKCISRSPYEGHFIKICIFFYQNAWNKKTKMTKTIDFPNEPLLKASKSKKKFFSNKSELILFNYLKKREITLIFMVF